MGIQKVTRTGQEQEHYILMWNAPGQYPTFRNPTTNPLIATSAPSGSIGDHGNLTGLEDDDHDIYLPRTGSRGMFGDIHMGGRSIISLGGTVSSAANLVLDANGGNSDIQIGQTTIARDFDRTLRVDGDIHANNVFSNFNSNAEFGNRALFGGGTEGHIIFASGDPTNSTKWEMDASGYYGIKWFNPGEVVSIVLNTDTNNVDISGYVTVLWPIASGHAANKAYVDTIVAQASGDVVSSISTVGEPRLTGDIILSSSGSVTLIQSGQNITISGAAAAGGAGASDHGGLTGLGDDDHTQYLTQGRYDTNINASGFMTALDIAASGYATEVLNAATSGAIIKDHNDLNNIDGGTTSQYYHLTSLQHSEITTFFNDTDITGAQAEELSDGSETALHIHDNRYYTETEIDSSGFLTSLAHTALSDMPSASNADHDGRYYTQTEIDASGINQSANFAGTNWTDLTDGGETSLHIHDDRYLTEWEIEGTYQKVDDLAASGFVPGADIDYAYVTANDGATDVSATELEELTDGSDTALHIHDGRYYTQTELDSSGFLTSLAHTGLSDMPSASNADHDGRYYTQTEIDASGINNSANFYGTNWTDLTDAGETSLHTHDHGGLNGKSDDDHTQYIINANTNATRNDITNQNSIWVPLRIIGAAGQAANLFEVEDTSNNDLFTIDPVGFVVINANSETAGDFQVKGDSDGNLLYVNAGDNNVGIGTASPGSKLDVRGAAVFNEDSLGAGEFRVETNTEPGGFVIDYANDNIHTAIDVTVSGILAVELGATGEKGIDVTVKDGAVTSAAMVSIDASNALAIAASVFDVKAHATQGSALMRLLASNNDILAQFDRLGGADFNTNANTSAFLEFNGPDGELFKANANTNNVWIGPAKNGNARLTVEALHNITGDDLGSAVSGCLRLTGINTGHAVGDKVELQFNGWETNGEKGEGVVGFETTSTSSGEKGDLYFATRNTTTGTDSPLKRFQIRDNGQLDASGTLNMNQHPIDFDTLATTKIEHIDSSGVLFTDTQAGTHSLTDLTTRQVGITVENPTDSEDITIVRFDKAVTITKVVGVIIGALASVTIDPKHHTDRTNAGNDLFSSPQVISSLTTGTVLTTFGDATILKDSFLWLETTAVGASPTELHLTFFYTVD